MFQKQFLSNEGRATDSAPLLVFRLDWYADQHRGPLLGEVTMFPYAGDAPTLLTNSANSLIRSLWVEPDGCPARANHLWEPHNSAASAHESQGQTTCASPLLSTAFGERQTCTTDGSLAPSIPSLQAAISHLPEDAAVISTLNNSELLAQLRAFDLGPWGVSSRQRVAILIPNGGTMPSALLSVMNRYCAVPLNPESPISELAQQLSQSRSVCVLCVQHGTVLDRAQAASHAAGVQLIVIERRGAREGYFSLPTSPKSALVQGHMSAGVLPSHIEPCLAEEGWCNGLHDVVLVLTTSGTTGRSKNVPFTLDRSFASGRALAESMQLCGTDCGINMMPLHHVGGIMCNLIAPLLSRGCCFFSEGFSARAWLGAIQNHTPSVTWSYAVPSMWAAILQEARTSWSEASRHNLRLLRSGAAVLPHSDAQRLVTLLGPSICVLPTYSMTECMPIASPPLGYSLGKPGSVGKPMLELCVLNVSADIELLPGQVGEIALMHGAQLFLGYDTSTDNPQSGVADMSIEAPARIPTAKVPFRTGDIGYVSPDGWLYITGRSAP